MRILLVEDDPTTSKSVELMLSNANLNVYATDLGEEGVDLAKLYDYDLILLDLNLPDMNGHEVLRKLRLAKIETPALRKKLAQATGGENYIETVWGRGYVLRDPLPVEDRPKMVVGG